MASFKESQIIDKLTANNYSTWKFKLEMLLIKEDLYDAITEEPPDPITNEWRKKDNKARAFINLFIDDAHIVHVKSETTARGTWQVLKNIHERSNLSSKLYLLRKLYSTKLPEGGNMIKHITDILQYVDKLNAIGETISDSHISALFLCSLPPSYDTLITALEARSETELTPDFIRSKLVDEYNRRIENKDSSSENATKAFNTQRKYTSNNNYRKENKYCSYCHMKSHYKSECWHLKNKTSQTYKNNNRESRNKKYSSSLAFETNQHNLRRNEKFSEQKTKVETSIETVTDTNQNTNLAFLTNKPDKQTWIIDSGSSSHISNCRELFTEIKNTEKSSVVIANGNVLNSHGSGEIILKTKTSEGKIKNITLKDVLFVPDIESNLLSVRKATQNGCKIIFEKDKCDLKYNNITFLEGKIKNNLYEVILAESSNKDYAKLTYNCRNRNCIELWHRRLGHKNYGSIKEIISKQLASGIEINNCKHDTLCETCIKTKISDMPYPKSAQNRGTKVLQLIHTDVCGPFQTPTIGGKTYFLTLIDDFSRFTIIYLLSKKSEVLTKLKEYIAMVSNKFGKKPEMLRSDNGGEYINDEIENYLKENGIQHQLTVPHCPSQNGVAERKNRTLLEMTRSLLSEANLPQKFWGEAINTATYLQNRLPTKSNDKTPYEIWSKRKPNLSYLKVFGCKAYAYINKSKRGKLDDKAQEGIFVGYDNRSKGYRIYTQGKNVIISRTVKFIETKFLNSNTKPEEYLKLEEKITDENEHSQKGENSLEIEIGNTPENEQTESEGVTSDKPRRSERTNKGVPPDRFIYLTRYDPIIEPKSWKEIQEIKNPQEKQNWLKATQEEIRSLEENKTWTLVNPPQGQKVIGSKWTFKAKYDCTGEVKKYKARLVAKGFLQKFGEDYDETFAPVVSYTSIRSFLAAAAYKKLKVNHVDIKTAFLHGDLEEEVYMTQPEGYITPGEENKVCKLNKAIYGLKQAARAWHFKIAESLKEMNFVQSTADSCLFVRNEGEHTSYIIVYVDDLLIAAKDKQMEEIIQCLRNEYELKDLGDANYYLGIKIERKNETCFELNQKIKIEEIVRKFNLEESKPCHTPMEPGYLRSEDEDNPLPNNTKYRQAIGALLYLATVTRPDISAAVNILSRKNENPREKDWSAVKRLIRYLNTTKNLNLVINTKSEPVLTTYADADWAGDKTDRKSTSGNLFLLGKNPIQWITKRQSCVALSSAEAEYVSAANAAQETLWIIKLLEDLNLPQNLPIKMYEDNQSCIKMIQSEKYTSKTKHIDIKFHCIKHLRETGIIDLEYCPSKLMTADILTKPAPKPDLVKHRVNLQLLPHLVPEIKGEY